MDSERVSGHREQSSSQKTGGSFAFLFASGPCVANFPRHVSPLDLFLLLLIESQLQPFTSARLRFASSDLAMPRPRAGALLPAFLLAAVLLGCLSLLRLPCSQQAFAAPSPTIKSPATAAVGAAEYDATLDDMNVEWADVHTASKNGCGFCLG
eukprot:s186_g22.t1